MKTKTFFCGQRKRQRNLWPFSTAANILIEFKWTMILSIDSKWHGNCIFNDFFYAVTPRTPHGNSAGTRLAKYI